MSAEDVTQTPGFRLRDLILRGAEPPPAAFVARLACYPWLIVGVTCIGAFIGQLDASIVQLALPALGRTFDATLESVSWVALGYLLAFASFLPIFGQLCDIYGRKLLYLIGFLLFAGASALCGLAPDLPSLVAFRVLQGVGGAMLGANSISVLVKRDRHRAARPRPRRLRGRPGGRGQRGSRRRRFSAGEPWLAVGVLGHGSVRARRRDHRLAGAAADARPRSALVVRLARRAAAGAGVDAGWFLCSTRFLRWDRPRRR